MVSTLEEYYMQLCVNQSKRHGKDYLLVHNEIQKRTKECRTYTEFGVQRGTTLAAALFQNPERVRAYDINLSLYSSWHKLFEEYSTTHNVDFKIFKQDTLKITIDEVDVLYINTCHMYHHLKKELQRHEGKVQYYIIIHDTNAKPDLKKAINELVKNKKWEVVEECRTHVGFITIKRK